MAKIFRMSSENRKAQFPKSNVQVYKINIESVTHFRRFISVKVKKY